MPSTTKHDENMRDSLSSDMSPTQQAVTAAQVLENTTPSTTSSQVNDANLGDKLHHLLKNIESIESENSELERKLSSTCVSHTSSQMSHSSPQKSYKCASDCFRINTTKNVKLHHQMMTHWMFLHTSQSYHSGIASLDYLKSDDRIQWKVQKKLQQLQGTSRTALSGNKTVKSGLHRSGDNNVKKEIGWPHHFSFPGQSGSQLPDYQDLSPLQFMVGYVCRMKHLTQSGKI